MDSQSTNSECMFSLTSDSVAGTAEAEKQVRLLICFDGHWDINYQFKSKLDVAIYIPQEISFVSLVHSIKAALFRVTTETQFQLSYLVQSCPPPITINNDADLRFYIQLQSHRDDIAHLPLCVEVIRNTAPNSQCSEPLTPTLNFSPVLPVPHPVSKQIPTHSGNTSDAPMHCEDYVTTLQPEVISHYHPTTIRFLSIYKSKLDLCHHLQMYAVTNNFQYRTKVSNKSSLHVVCLDETCPWTLRAVRKDNSEFFEIRRFDHVHTCKVDFREGDHRQATSGLVAELVKHHYLDATKKQFSPNDIREEMRMRYGVSMSYKKSLMVKQKALTKLYGTDDESYKLLPSLCHVLMQTNPGSAVSLLITEDHRFKYMFFSLAAWRQAWNHCIPVLVIDGTFMKAYYKGTLLTACCQDANKQIVPIAFGICDTEDKSSWTWFLKRVKESLTVRSDMYIVSDRHEGILSAISEVFPNTPHGYCSEHITRNISGKFKGPKQDLCWKFRAAARAATEVELEEYLKLLDAQDLRVRTYLDSIGESKWSRCKSGPLRYSVMTSNLAESMNNVNKSARDYPVVKLVDFIRERMQKWFHERFEKASTTTTVLPKKIEDELIALQRDGLRMKVKPASTSEFEVVDGWSRSFIVNLRDKTCTCGEFQLDHFVCVHASAAIATRPGLSCYDFVSSYYKREALIATYMGIVHPVGDKSSWEVPPDVQAVLCLPPSCNKRPPGRPKKCRYPSIGEPHTGSVRKKQRCTRCQQIGHNKKTCSNPIPTQ